MRVSGRKLRLAVGSGIASLMLMLGVTSVGATAPGAVGNINVVVTSSGASAISSPSTTTTAAVYRDAPVITNQLAPPGGLDNGNAGTYDECLYVVTGNPNSTFNPQGRSGPNGNVSNTDVTPFICQNPEFIPIIQPASYPLWEVQVGTTNGQNSRTGTNLLVVPPTQATQIVVNGVAVQVGGNGTAPGRAYVIENFR